MIIAPYSFFLLTSFFFHLGSSCPILAPSCWMLGSRLSPITLPATVKAIQHGGSGGGPVPSRPRDSSLTQHIRLSPWQLFLPAACFRLLAGCLVLGFRRLSSPATVKAIQHRGSGGGPLPSRPRDSPLTQHIRLSPWRGSAQPAQRRLASSAHHAPQPRCTFPPLILISSYPILVPSGPIMVPSWLILAPS